MKALKISDQTHAGLTRVAGQLTAESDKIKTYEETIEVLLHRPTLLPPELLHEIKTFLEKKQAGRLCNERRVPKGSCTFSDGATPTENIKSPPAINLSLSFLSVNPPKCTRQNVSSPRKTLGKT